ncbi:PREDICTED: vomeronasal type-2 receptor 1-like [Nanorana parkeri]|uniref:vomeronasal type-2 receptor 1-like n=1 Tax=Nanorana parkeri TaxID=125878 RepID=UPI00085415BD|nr:PREDICTED: vomeronasal type-2 receptor 1-like [Nanorana parkeri]
MDILYTAIWKLTLIHLILALYFHDNRCKLEMSEMKGTTRMGDIMVGFIIPLYLDKVYEQVSFTERPPKTTCALFHFENYQQLQALIFAVNEINENPNLLSNVTLGFQAYDSCSDLHLALKGSLQVSHFSTSPLLSDRTKFPSFFRTVPSDMFQSKGLSELVLHFGWTWVGLLALDNDYGQQGIQLVRKEIVQAGACVAFMKSIQTDRPDRNAPGIVADMKKSTAKVIVAFSDAINLLPILDEMLIQNVTDKIFVASEAWSTSSLFSPHPYSNLLSGTVGIALYSGTMPGFKEFLNKNRPSTDLRDYWVKDFWEKVFDCKFMDQKNVTDSLVTLTNKCSGNENLEDIHNSYNDVSSLRVTYNVYTAIHVIVRALEDLRGCSAATGPFSHSICEDARKFKPWQILHYMKTVTVKLSTGRELYFDHNGDPPAVYDIVNWQLSPEGTISHMKIGSYDSTRKEPFTIDSKSTILHYMKTVTVKLSTGRELYFDHNGDPPAVYDIVNWQLSPEGTISHMKIGSYDSTRKEPFTIDSKSTRCKLEMSKLKGATRMGDIAIGLIIPLYLYKANEQLSFTEIPPKTICSMFHFEGYQQLQAFRYAVNEINSNSNILSNITIGFQVYTSCNDLHLDLKASLQLLTGEGPAIPNYFCGNDVPLISVIGASISTNSMAMANLLGLYKYPQVSHFSTSPLLSDRIQFPSFFRTVPSDTFQSKGLSALVLHFGWTWIGLLALDDDYGQQGILMVKKEIVKAGACVAFIGNILRNSPDRNAPNLVKVIKKSTADVIIAFSDDFYLLPVLDEMLVQNVTNKVLVASEAWATSSLLSAHPYSRLLSGTVAIALYSGTIPGFKEFLNNNHPSMDPFDYWVQGSLENELNYNFTDQKKTTNYLSDSGEKCTGTENLKNTENSYYDVSSLRVTYSVYTAVHVIARALEDWKNFNAVTGTFLDFRHFRPWQLLYYMQKVKVRLSNGRELYFDENGDPPAVYDLVNWQMTPEGTIRHVKIGSYDVSNAQPFTIDSNATLWASGNKQSPRSACSVSCPPGFRKVAIHGQPACCFECVPCSQGEISNQTDSLDCSNCPWDQWPNSEKSTCLLKTIEYLSYDDPMGAALTLIGTLSFSVPVGMLMLFHSYKATPVVKANNYFLSCLLLVALSLCFLSSLAFIGYPRNEICFMRQATFGMAFTFCISCILAKTITVIFAFAATKPNSRLSRWTKLQVTYIIVAICSFLQFILCVSWLTLRPPYSQINLQEKPGVIIVECNENSPSAFWTMLGYLFLLATKSFVVAFLARRLPDTFNEAKLITFSMLAFLSIWVSFIPAYLSSTGKNTVALESFAIQSSTWVLIACLFFPKCFIILWRPAMNSREHVVTRGRK